MDAGCPFITCAVKRKGIEFCGDCGENTTCGKWEKHRKAGRHHDSFVCYQRLEDSIASIRKNGIKAFDAGEKERARLLREILDEFDDGRSKSCYCIAATVMETGELKEVLYAARGRSQGEDRKDKAKIFHSLLDAVAARRGYFLKLRK